MREEIAQLVKEIRYKPNHSDKQSWQFADQILTFISEEIQKIGNPYVLHTLTHHNYYGFEAARQQILSLLKDGKDTR